MEIDYKYRIGVAENYFQTLEINLQKGWQSIYTEYLNGQMGIIDKLTMIHPEFIKNIILPAHTNHEKLIEAIQGNRLFKKEPGSCQSELLWGYKCSYNIPICQGDHLFPYSLGGPTSGNNKLLLCKYHNMVKSVDIHLFPWENNRLFWLDTQIQKLYNIISIYI